jgi:dihydrofolate synthase/folylpolyglutamate synthase
VFERIEAVRGDLALTYFEYGTLAALMAFRLLDLDLWVLEVGLGGRLDAINAFDPDAAVVVSISLDHVDYLGPDLQGIGREKAGIFRPGRPAVLGSTEMPESVALEATRIGARVLRIGTDFQVRRHDRGFDYLGLAGDIPDLPAPRLAGNAQYGNAATALAVLESLGQLPSPEAIANGLSQVELTGRYQVIDGPVQWVFDVAHNEGSAAVLADTLNERRAEGGRTLFVAGMLVDKDAHRVAEIIATAVRPSDAVIAVTLEGDRGRNALDLAAIWSPVLGCEVAVADSIPAGCAAAAARAVPGDRVVVFGSFHTVAPALEWRRARD